MPVILSHSDIQAILHSLTADEWASLVHSFQRALNDYSRTPEIVSQPPRTSITLGSGITTTLFMPCSYDGNTSIKTVTLSADQPPKGTITILDSCDGELRGLLNAEEITAFRTALASNLAMPKRVIGKAVVFGTGRQAEWAVRLLQRDGEVDVTAVGRGTGEEVRAKVLAWGLKKIVATIGRRDGGAEDALAHAVKAADAIFCCTPSITPLFPGEWLWSNSTEQKRAKYVSLIGSYKPHMLEVEPEVLRNNDVKVVVDSIEACLSEAGEVIQAELRKGELSELGLILGDANWEQLVGTGCGGLLVFKCVGLAIMDLAVGREIMRIAEERCAGTRVYDFD